MTGRIASFAWTADEIGDHLLELGNAMAAEDGGDDASQAIPAAGSSWRPA